MAEDTESFEQRVFDLYDADVTEQIAAFFRKDRDAEDPNGDWREYVTEAQLKAAIAAATNADHTVKLTRWKKLPANAFRQHPNAT